MNHPIFRIVKFRKAGPYTLQIYFDDETERIIDFSPILHGSLYGALADQTVFDQVELDPETHTLVWPNGADFDPATLHDWLYYEKAMIELISRSAELIET